MTMVDGIDLDAEYASAMAKYRVRRFLGMSPIKPVSPDHSPIWRFTRSHGKPRESVKGEVYIYGLADPGDHVIRYVGKTVKDVRVRAAGHMCEPTNEAMALWASQLRERGETFEVVIMETCNERNWEHVERKWIAQLRRLGSLLNISRGGKRGSECGRSYKGNRSHGGPVKVFTKDEIAQLALRPSR
jgi:hypothetical protein